MDWCSCTLRKSGRRCNSLLCTRHQAGTPSRRSFIGYSFLPMFLLPFARANPSGRIHKPRRSLIPECAFPTIFWVARPCAGSVSRGSLPRPTRPRRSHPPPPSCSRTSSPRPRRPSRSGTPSVWLTACSSSSSTRAPCPAATGSLPALLGNSCLKDLKTSKISKPKPQPQLSALSQQTINPQPSTLNIQLNSRLSTLNPQPSALNPQPSTLNPQPSTLNPQPSTLNPQVSAPNPEP